MKDKSTKVSQEGKPEVTLSVQKAPYDLKSGRKIDLGYDPQGSGMDHDPFFAEVAPGVATSGNMKFKWTVPGNHLNPVEPPSDLRGD
jgi:hypothetical protein